MGRLLLACVLGCAIFALAALQFGFINSEEGTSLSANAAKRIHPAVNLGNSLYPPAPEPAPSPAVERKVDPVAVLGNMAVIDRPEIAAQVPGQIMFIGEDVPEGAAQVAGAAAFLAEPFYFTKINHGIRDVIMFYRRLYEGQTVHEDQVLAMVDPAKALGDIDIKRGKALMASADYKGAKAIAGEASVKFGTSTALLNRGAIAQEDYRSAELTRDKMAYDADGKLQAWYVANTEENMSQIIFNLHKIRNKIPVARSIIQKILKQRGEAVKEGEPVVQLYSLERLRAEAQINGEYGNRLHPGMLVTVEPSVVDSPPKTYSAHVNAVNCLSVTNDPVKPLIVSGGEDAVMLVWDRFVKNPVRVFKHPDAIKALATSPVGVAANLVVTGSGDGTIRLYDLAIQDNTKALVKEDHTHHNVAITALAFSPDGKYIASGGADGIIILWSTATLEPVYPFDEKHGVNEQHHGAISALHFTPQCQLVSASLDNTIAIWDLKEKGATLVDQLRGRNGSVTQIDVSSDGRWLLFDHGKTLQIRSVAGGMVNTLQNPGGAIPFETLALFSPDASLLLTAGASEGRLQLWKAPTAAARGFEVRQFATAEHVPVSCAAFAPLPDYSGAGTFAVSGNKEGQIYFWPLPSRAEVDHHQIREMPLRILTPGLNPSSQINIGVEVPNPPTPSHPKGRLEPGRNVTIVIE